jgi:hypothetical protein
MTPQARKWKRMEQIDEQEKYDTPMQEIGLIFFRLSGVGTRKSTASDFEKSLKAPEEPKSATGSAHEVEKWRRNLLGTILSGFHPFRMAILLVGPNRPS